MDNEILINTENLGDSIQNEEDVDFLINMFKKRLQFYKNQNIQNEQILSKLKINPDILNSSSKEILNNLTKLQEACGVNSVGSTDIGIAFLDIAQSKFEHGRELEKLKTSESNCIQLTDDINKEAENIEKEVELAQNQIDNIKSPSLIEINSIKKKISSYEDKLLQYIEKYPWTNKPEYNVLSMQDEIKRLYALCDELEKLKTEKDFYQGLKPDLYAAKCQLSNIKTEYEAICKAISDQNK